MVEVPFRIWVGAAQVWSAVGDSFVIAGATAIDYVVTVTRITGNVRVIPAAQLIEARDEAPGTPTAATIGSWTTSAVSTHNGTDLSTVTDKYRGRIGLLAELSGGTTQGWVEGMLSATLSQCVARIGERVPPPRAAVRRRPGSSVGSPRPARTRCAWR